MQKKSPEQTTDDIILSILTLPPGQRLVYYTGPAGWISQAGFEKLYRWINKPDTQEQYIFVQRRVNAREFEYIAHRKTGK